MALKFADAIVDKLKSVLTASLPAKLDAIDADANDGITLDDIAEYIDGEKEAVKFPACWILSQAGASEIEENRDQLYGQLPIGLYQHEIEIVVGVTDPNSATNLRKKLYRYALGMIQVLRDNEDTSEWIRAQVVAYTLRQVFQHMRESTWRQDVNLSVMVTRAD